MYVYNSVIIELGIREMWEIKSKYKMTKFCTFEKIPKYKTLMFFYVETNKRMTKM